MHKNTAWKSWLAPETTPVGWGSGLAELLPRQAQEEAQPAGDAGKSFIVHFLKVELK